MARVYSVPQPSIFGNFLNSPIAGQHFMQKLNSPDTDEPMTDEQMYRVVAWKIILPFPILWYSGALKDCSIRDPQL